MTDVVTRICLAIFRQEGMPASYTNPGNLRDCPWFPKDITLQRRYPDGETVKFRIQKGTNGRPDRKFWVPRTRAEGVAGAFHVVALRIAAGCSLRKLITDRVVGWAPASDGNRSEVYLANVSAWAQIPDVNVPLWNLLSVE